MSSGYTQHYYVPLLDDLHNYFPDLLYGPLEQFQTTQDVLRYIQSQVHTRFNLYNSGYRNHHHTEYRTPFQVSPPPPLIRPVSHIPSTRIAPNPTVPPSLFTTPPQPIQQVTARVTRQPALNTGLFFNNLIPRNLQADLSLIDLIHTTLNGTLHNTTIPNLSDPVIVRPSAEEVDHNTTIEIMDSEEEICAICQDRMEPGSEVRCLNACDHRFHIGCIDTWFQGNVRCPVCRHDVREPVEQYPLPDSPLSLPDLSGNDLDG